MDYGEGASGAADGERITRQVGRPAHLRQHAERPVIEGAEHHRHRALVGVLRARRQHADADRAHPMLDPGAHAHQLEDVLDAGRIDVRDVQEAQVVARPRRPQLLQAVRRRHAPVGGAGMGQGEGVFAGSGRGEHVPETDARDTSTRRLARFL
jgi:hypothetical protein